MDHSPVPDHGARQAPLLPPPEHRMSLPDPIPVVPQANEQVPTAQFNGIAGTCLTTAQVGALVPKIIG